MSKKLLVLFVILTLVTGIAFAGGSEDDGLETIVFGDVSWDSVQVHNRIAAFIIENGLEGYEADFVSGDTLPIINAIVQGDIDIDMESWHSNFPEVYAEGIESGDLIDLGKNMPDAPQGWWIPRYLVEGADAAAPDLKSVADLPKYAHLMKDPEDRSKGIVYGGVAGWSQLKISEAIFDEYNLADTYNMGIAGSGSALAGSMVGAYEKGEAWCGYYWAPTAVLGKLDMIRLEGSEYAPADVNILVTKTLPERAPDIVEFLKNYSSTVADNNEFLAMMSDNDWSAQETAEWFLKNKEAVWTAWVSEEIAAKVKAAL